MSFGLAFTYLMSYGGAVVALANPFVGLLIFVCFAIIRPGPGLWYWSVPQDGNFSKILALGLIAGWAVRGFGDWRLGRAEFVPVCLLGYLGWNVLSATQALIPPTAWEWVEGQTKVMLPCIIGITLIDSVTKLKQLAWVVLLSHGYVAYDLNMSYFSGYNRLQDIGFGGVDNNCNGIGFVTCIGMGIFLGLSAPRLWQKGLAGVCLAFLVHAVLFSFSRGAMLGLILVTAISFMLIPKRPVHYFVLLVGILVALATTGPQVMARLGSSFAGESERDGSAESRLQMWGICLQQAANNPFIGLGPHHFPVYARSFGLTEGKEAHTTWLQLVAEVGVPGVGLLLLYYIIPIVRLWPMTRESYPVPDPWLRDIARMVIAANIGFLFTAQFVTLPGLEAPYYVVLIGAGALKLMSVPGAIPEPVVGTPAPEVEHL